MHSFYLLLMLALPIVFSTRQLVLHFDINETILIGDEAGGDTKEDCLNKIIAKSAFVRRPTTDSKDATGADDSPHPFHYRTLSKIVPTEWQDGTPIHSNPLLRREQPRQEQDESERTTTTTRACSTNVPPPLNTNWEWPPDCIPYYRTSFQRKSKTFTRHDGIGYRPIYDKMSNVLQFDEKHTAGGEAAIDQRLCKDGKSHFLLPAFFHTLYNLAKQSNDQNVRIVIRSFGSDVHDVVDAINAFATGHHPDYPDFEKKEWILGGENMFRGRWDRRRGGEGVYRLHRWNGGGGDDNEGSTTVVASGDEEVLDVIESQWICAIQDDYQYWYDHDCQPHAGKPIWVRSPLGQSLRNYHHHIIFDDNIKNDPDDSIVGVRWQGPYPPGLALESMDSSKELSGSSFFSLTGDSVRKLQAKYLVQVPTMEPILNLNWFLQQIEECEKSISALMIPN